MKVPQLIDLITFWEACPTSHLANINFVSTLSTKNLITWIGGSLQKTSQQMVHIEKRKGNKF